MYLQSLKVALLYVYHGVSTCRLELLGWGEREGVGMVTGGIGCVGSKWILRSSDLRNINGSISSGHSVTRSESQLLTNNSHIAGRKSEITAVGPSTSYSAGNLGSVVLVDGQDAQTVL